ncbi:MAG: DUF3341 domain-containing protein [Deltaproteobacteria bacterium]|nr:DUF3341 domain-containing protein [Deltaproteobacteria bacterium]
MFKKYLVGHFREEDALLGAVRAMRERGFAIEDVYSPYAIHGIDEAMGLKRSRLPYVTFAAGFAGLALAMAFQYWTSVVDWPINVGGKPDNSTLAWLPVAFEITVLLGALSTVAAFLLRSRLFPGSRARVFHPRVTSDTFALVLEQRDASLDEPQARRLLGELGAFAVESKEVLC